MTILIYIESEGTLQIHRSALAQSFMKYYGFSEEQAQTGVEKYREYFRDTGIFENEPYQGIDRLLDCRPRQEAVNRRHLKTKGICR